MRQRLPMFKLLRGGGGGGGGGGFRPIILETLILRYELKGKARTRPDPFRVVLVHAHNFTHLRPRSKNGTKHQNPNQKR